MSTNHPLIHPRDEVMQTMERIYHFRMTTTSGGNVSLKDDNGDIWITPARVDKGSLRREDIVCVKAGGGVEGIHKPSSEYAFHKAVYDARPDIMGVVHGHPVALVAFSIVRQAPNTSVFHQARHVCGEVGFAPYAIPGSDELAENIARTFSAGHRCVVLENHGVVTGAESLQTAFQQFETLEFTARTIIRAGMVGGARYLTDEQVELPRRSHKPLPFFERDTPTSREKDLREQLCRFVRRGYQQRLLISTEGSFSARLDKDAFLITPYQVDRNTINLDDIVLIRDGAAEAGKRPSRASRNHAAVYQRCPEVGAIVNAYTVNANAFSVSGAALNSRTIPESYIFLRDVGRIPYGVQFTDPEAFASYICPEQPIALLENDGVLVTGADVLAAFDRLEVLESTADAIIESSPVGPVAPMSDEVIRELDRAFLNK